MSVDALVPELSFSDSVKTSLQEGDSLGFESLSDAQQFTLKEACFELFTELAEQGGLSNGDRPDRQEASYRGESYCVFVEEGAAIRLCSVYDNKGELTFNAYETVDPDSGSTTAFTVTDCSLDSSTILQASEAYLSEPDKTKAGIESVASELKRLGGFAPTGSKALLVAESVLRLEGKPEKTGEVYSFARTEVGGLEGQGRSLSAIAGVNGARWRCGSRKVESN